MNITKKMKKEGDTSGNLCGMEVFVDETLTEEASASYAGAINTTNSNPLRIGADRNNSSWYNGYLDDFRITKGVARYTSAFTPAIIPPMEVNTRYIGQIGGWDDIDVDYGVNKKEGD